MSDMEESNQPTEELEILRKLNSVVSVINDYCSYSGELKPNVLFYLLKLELLNDNAFATFNEVEVIWTKNEDSYGKNQFGQESVVFKNRNTFPSELCDDQITGAGAAEMKNVDGEISEEILGESLNDETVCKLEENAEESQISEVATPIFVQNEGYEDIAQVAEHIQGPNELQFTLAVQGTETYEYIQNDHGMESFEIEAPGNIFSSRGQALQALHVPSISGNTKLVTLGNVANADDEVENDTLKDEVQEKLTKSKQIVVNDRRLVPTYECPECGKKFSVAHHLKNHLLSHYKIKNLMCNLCKKRFSENCHLTRHMKLTHGIGLERKYPCKVCKKEFPTVPRLVQHLKIHTGDTPHICDMCPARFPTATSLLWHKKAHSSEVQFPCNVCGWVYKSKGVCQNHVKKYHPELYDHEPKSAIQRQKSKRTEEVVDVATKNKKFNKLLNKLRERNLIKETVGKKNTDKENESNNHSKDVHTSDIEEDFKEEYEGSELSQSEGDKEDDLFVKLNEEINKAQDSITQNEEDLEEELGREDSGRMETMDEDTPRRSVRKRKIKAVYGEAVPALSFIKQEPAAEVDGDNDAIPQTNPEDSAARTQIHRSKDKGNEKLMKKAEEPHKQETEDQESAESSTPLGRKGQKLAACGHFSVSWDKHQFCGMCRFKGKGSDPCASATGRGGDGTEEGKTCDVCEGLTAEQRQYHSIRRRAFEKRKEIGKTKAQLKSLRKAKKQEADTAVKTEQGEFDTGEDGSLLLQDGLTASSLTAVEVNEENYDDDFLPNLAEAHLDVKSYQKELQNKYRWYKCLYCEASFLHKTALVTHMNNVHEHTEEILFPCTECQKVFATLAQLKRHFTTHGIGAVLTPCPECGRTFRDKSNLSKHRLIHLDVKLFTCEFCGKAFSNCGGLTIHRRTHTGIRPYHCRYCEKSFTNAGALRGHERVHTGEKPYVCDICGVCFRDRSHLNRHKKSHVKSDRVRPYRCGLCGKTFSAQVNLTKHLRGHSMKTEPS